jgi:putative selenium metabolism protein SsnA
MTIIKNGTVVTRDATNTVIADGAVAYEGAKIVAVGTTADVTKKYGAGAAVIDARGRLVMPGFINAHMHYYSTFARGMSLGGRASTTFGEILRGLWWRLDKELTLEDVYYSCIGPMIDAVRAGTTTVFDHHASPFAVTGSLFKIAEAAKLFGIRSNLCYETSDRDGAKIADEGIAENVAWAKHCADARKADPTAGDLVGGLFGLHASLTISTPTLDKCLAAAKSAGVGFHVHVAEGFEDVADATAKYDRRVAERFVEAGVMGPDSLAVHCIHVTDAEKAQIAASGTAVVHNPMSNMGNAVGTSPVLDLLKRGVTVGLGTDGYTADVLDSLKTAAVLHKHASGDPSVAWGEPPQMLFANNAAIANRHLSAGKVGTLAAGAYADVIIVDYKGPTPVNSGTVNSHILFGVTGRHVDTTIINGKTVMDERTLVTVDEDALMAKSREHAEKLWARI